MTALAHGATAVDAPVEQTATPKKRFNAGNLATMAVIALIIFWCLAPFYWMLVLAFRETAFTFETTPWFTHVTLENFRYAFDTTDNKFGRSLFNSVLIGAVVTF